MAVSNRDQVGRVMDALKAGLAPFIVREFKRVYRERAAREIDALITTNTYELPSPAFSDETTLLRELDTQRCLNLMWKAWDAVFKEKLERSARSLVSLLTDNRNEWAHNQPFTNDAAYRVADNALQLLEAAGAAEQVAQVKEISNALLRQRYESEARGRTRIATPSGTGQLPSTPTGLRGWRYITEPHPDVASGRYMQAEFAADLAQVISGKASAEYGDPREFFRRTYLTQGLTDLLVNSMRRATGQGGDPVVQLQTAFGGGKTHSMLAVYHLLGGGLKLSDLENADNLIRAVEKIDLPTANRAVVVGTAFNVATPRQHAGVTTYTLWGEIAYQLGKAAGKGAESYALVADADVRGVNPGADTLLQLLDDYGPALIILDEMVAFARNLYGLTERVAAGTFDSLMSFVQSLTEAVKRSSDSLLLISLPESERRITHADGSISVIDSSNEIGGEGGKAALEALARHVGRIEAVWKPVSATESYEIVRRRLFSPQMDYAARDAVINAYVQMYQAGKTDFPREVSESAYIAHMKAAYPIHPELFERLYHDWSTLERFQRTRGVLRFMAAVIHELWVNNDESLLIMPSSVPLYAPPVRNEITRYLPDGWVAIIDNDIDGEHARPRGIDEAVPALGRYRMCLRVARAIFMGSAPATGAIKGVEEMRLRLGTVQPGGDNGMFGDALRRMSDQLTYLFNEGSRYWYDTRPTVNRLAAERSQGFRPDDVLHEIERRLQSAPGRNEFRGAHIAPSSSADVSDEAYVRLVVLSPNQPHKKNGTISEAQKAAQDILENRGGGALRVRRNMLVFLAAEKNDMPSIEAAARDFMAWRDLDAERESLNLDPQQARQVQTAKARADETFSRRIQEAYVWVLVPSQPEPAAPLIAWESFRLKGDGNFYAKAVRLLRENAQLIHKMNGEALLQEMHERNLWRGEPYVSLKTLWGYFANLPYLSRLASEQVFLNTVQDGVQNGQFGYASAILADGQYQGLRYRETANIQLNDQCVVVAAEVAVAQIAVEAAESDERRRQIEEIERRRKEGERRITPDTPPPPAPRRKTRFHAEKKLNALRPLTDMDPIVQNVLQHLTQLSDCEVSVTLIIQARRPDGFEDQTVLVVGENARTLKFEIGQFEER